MLVSVVSLVVGLLTVPISLVADRWGRVKSITLMAFVWCLATVACGLAQSYGQLLWARAFVGLGEAAYGAAGAALLAHVFPAGSAPRCWAPFLSASLFGSVLGVVLGGAVAAQSGWRMAFFVVGAPGLLLALIYPFVVRDYKTVAMTADGRGRRGTEAASSTRSRAKCSPHARATSPTSPAACRWRCRRC